MSLYTDADKGTLTQDKLKRYLEKNDVNAPSQERDNGTIGLTPLALAARGGHIKVVRMLLGPPSNAAVDALSTLYRTPLWLATARSRDSRHRAEVVQALLQYKANASYSHPKLRGATPLENELHQRRDVSVIQLLVEAGGVSKNAETYAHSLKDAKIDAAMKPRSQLRRIHDQAVGMITSLVLFVFDFVNKNTGLFKATNKIFRRFHIRGENKGDAQAEKIAKQIGQPQTKEEFEASVNDFITKRNLGQFFSKEDSGLIQTVTSRAVDLQNDDTTDLGDPSNTGGLVQLSLYQPIIYCDDSTSMNLDFNRYEDRIKEQREVVHRIAGICTKIVPDDMGIHLRFINKRIAEANNLRMEDTERIMKDIIGNGATQIGTNLRQQILDPFIYEAHANGTMKRPLFISIITDGVPSNEQPSQLVNEIIQCEEFLKENGLSPRSVVFQISQIGSDEDSKAFISGLALDGRLENVYVTSQQLDTKFRELQNNERDLEAWLFKTLLAPILNQE